MPIKTMDVCRDQSGTWCLSQVTCRGDHSFHLIRDVEEAREWFEMGCSGEMLLWDMRAIVALDMGDLVDREAIDLHLLCPDARTLAACPGMDETVRQTLAAQESMFHAAARASATAGIDLRKHSLFDQFDPDHLREVFRCRAMAMTMVHREFIQQHPDGLWRGTGRRLGMFRRLLQTEAGGISIDHDLLEEHQDEPFFRSVCGHLTAEGLVHPRFGHKFTRTGRVTTDGGFPCMNVPHGLARRLIMSRFTGGRVYALDFNAIDYRCIVASVPEVVHLYADASDFHLRTKEICGLAGLDRDQVKFASYIYIYGGSDETLAAKLGVSLDEARSIVARISSCLAPIGEFRQRLHVGAMERGRVFLPDGTTSVDVSPMDHPGKVLGLYAQTYSSSVFERAFVVVHDFLKDKRSRIMFPVHDELVLDVHPYEEDSVPERVAELMSHGMHQIKTKRGLNYDETSVA